MASVSFPSIKPIKSLGQHFLCSRRIAEKLIDALEPLKKDVVIEVGAGGGFLTRLIARKAKKVIAVEIDKRFIEKLKNLSQEYENIEVVEKDILEFDFKENNVLIFGNLPYKISGPFIFWLLKKRKKFKRGVFTFQREFGERLIAKRNTSSYGALSVIVQTFFNVKRLFYIPSFYFKPKPKVDSIVLRFIPKEKNLKVDEELFIKMVKNSFSHRRKTLLNNLAKTTGLSREEIKKFGIGEKTRPQELLPEDYERLTHYISS